MILIIGAGITGLTAAACLQGDVLVVEAQDAVGGYCRTTKRNGFVWDRAGHFFHFQNPQIKQFFQKQIPANRFVHVKKKSSIHLEEHGVIDFPFQKNIHQLPKDIYIKCLTDLYEATQTQAKYSSFKEFVYATMGAGIADNFLIPYNEKLYACDLNALDRDAMGRFFPKASFEDILMNARDNDNNNSYNADFAYPIGGAEEFVDVIHKYAAQNADIRLNTTVSKLDLDKKEAVLSDGSIVNYDAVINTSPLNRFCDLANIDYKHANLSANKVAVFNLGFDSKSDHEMHWVYFPGSEVFYRVGSYHNIMATDRASLYVEMGFASHETIDEQALLKQVLIDLERTGIITKQMNLIDHEFIIMNPAYVHINQQAEAFKAQNKITLAQKNAYSAGRYGNWTYCSIEDNMVEARDLCIPLVEALKNSGNTAYQFNDIFSE